MWGKDLSTEAVEELHHTTALALHTIIQTAAATGCAIAAMVAMERHLWFNLVDIGRKDKAFLLDALLLPSWVSALPLRWWSESSGRQRHSLLPSGR